MLVEELGGPCVGNAAVLVCSHIFGFPFASDAGARRKCFQDLIELCEYLPQQGQLIAGHDSVVSWLDKEIAPALRQHTMRVVAEPLQKLEKAFESVNALSIGYVTDLAGIKPLVAAVREVGADFEKLVKDLEGAVAGDVQSQRLQFHARTCRLGLSAAGTLSACGCDITKLKVATLQSSLRPGAVVRVYDADEASAS